MSKKTFTLKGYYGPNIDITVENRNNRLFIRPEGYGNHMSKDGHGWPVTLEFVDDVVRVVVWDDINKDDPEEIDLWRAKETNRETN